MQAKVKFIKNSLYTANSSITQTWEKLIQPKVKFIKNSFYKANSSTTWKKQTALKDGLERYKPTKKNLLVLQDLSHKVFLVSKRIQEEIEIKIRDMNYTVSKKINIRNFTCGYFRLLSEMTADGAIGGIGHPPGQPQPGGLFERKTLWGQPFAKIFLNQGLIQFKVKSLDILSRNESFRLGCPNSKRMVRNLNTYDFSLWYSVQM